MTARATMFLILLLGIALPSLAAEPLAEADRLVQADDGSKDTLRRIVDLYEQAAKADPKNAAIQRKLAAVCLELGGHLGEGGLSTYQKGEQAARRALELDERSADAHFLVAANRGKAAKLLPLWKVSPGVVGELEKDLLRAIALDPRHARSLHMEGMLLQKTPAPLRLFLEGKKSDVERYLTSAVKADPTFEPARLDLAEYYLATGRPAEARAQARAVLDGKPSRPRIWKEKYRPEAEALLKKVPTSS